MKSEQVLSDASLEISSTYVFKLLLRTNLRLDLKIDNEKPKAPQQNRSGSCISKSASNS